MSLTNSPKIYGTIFGMKPYSNWKISFQSTVIILFNINALILQNQTKDLQCNLMFLFLYVGMLEDWTYMGEKISYFHFHQFSYFDWFFSNFVYLSITVSAENTVFDWSKSLEDVMCTNPGLTLSVNINIMLKKITDKL